MLIIVFKYCVKNKKGDFRKNNFNEKETNLKLSPFNYS
jgi:hypothetical protein